MAEATLKQKKWLVFNGQSSRWTANQVKDLTSAEAFRVIRTLSKGGRYTYEDILNERELFADPPR